MRKIGIATMMKALAGAATSLEGSLKQPAKKEKYPNPPRANLSRNHPDYGLTPAEHFARKAERNK
jgi:hypothetical protein